MIYEKFLYIGKRDAARIRKALEWKEGNNPDDRLTEEESITHTVVFDDGFEMDIKCCGVRYNENEKDNSAWTEAVLFCNGYEVCCTEPSDKYFGTWECEDSYSDNTYRVFVRRSKSTFDFDCFWNEYLSSYSSIAVSKERYSFDEAVKVAIQELGLETDFKLSVKDAYVRFRAGVDDDGEKRVCWWLEDEEYATSCPVWEFCVPRDDIKSFMADYRDVKDN